MRFNRIIAACISFTIGFGVLASDDQGGNASGKMLTPKTITADTRGNHGEYDTSVLCDGIRLPVRWWDVWSSRSNRVEPHWLELRFDAPVAVRAVAIHWGTENGVALSSRNYKIQWQEAKAPKGVYKDILEVKDNPPTPFTVHEFEEVKTSVIRIWQPEGGGPERQPDVMSAAEIEVYDYAKSPKEFGGPLDKEQTLRLQAESRARLVGVFKRLGWMFRGSAVTTALAKMKKSFIEMDELDERELKRCGILVIDGVRHVPNKDAVINFIANGGAVLFLHNSCGRSGGSPLPEIWEYAGIGKSALVVKDKEHPVTKGLPERFTHNYADHAFLKVGPNGKVLLADEEGNAVVIAGQVGEGKVIAMGNFPGLASGPDWQDVKVVKYPPADTENDLMTNSVNWLAEGTVARGEWKDSPEAKAWRQKDQSRKKQFTDVTEASGMAFHGYSKGAAMADVFEKGRLDIFATLVKGGNLFYRNDGNWKFSEVSKEAGVDRPHGIGCAFGDVNGDGHLDLFVCWFPEMEIKGQPAERSALYLGDGQGRFRDATDEAGLGGIGKTAMCIMSDVDNDGRLDLYLIGYEAENKLYRNRGDGTFEDVTAAFGLSGLGSQSEKGYGGNLSAIMADLDGDGYQDLICFSGGMLKLLRNKAGKGFEEVADFMGAGKPVPAFRSLGIALGDIDNDGDLDVYISCHDGSCKLLRNDGQMRFTDISAAAGFETFEKYIGAYGPMFVDYDNDGYLDLFQGTGGYDSMVYRNNGDGTFTDVTATIGLDIFGAHGFNFGDLDGDGDMDFYATAWGKDFKLLRNNQDDRNYLKVRVKGRKSNTAGIGAKIWVYGERGKDQKRILKGYREISGGGGAMYTCSPLEQHFGLPGEGRYTVEVLFPATGKRVSLPDVSAAQMITVEEPE